MTKQYVADTYGDVLRTIGEGCSAGSLQQITLAIMYPGLLDGLLISRSFPDSEAALVEATDALLLRRYFQSDAFKASNGGAKAEDILKTEIAISGHKDMGSLQSWEFMRSLLFPGVYGDAPGHNNCMLPTAAVYDARANRDCAHCAIADHSINIWGRYPNTGTARSYIDNVGVEYGLKALLGGSDYLRRLHSIE